MTMNTLLTPEDLWLGATVLALIGKSTLILAGAGLISLASRRSSAAARHAVWTSALTAILALPLLSASLPEWSWSVLPAPTAPVVEPAAHIDSQSITTPDRIAPRPPEITAEATPAALPAPAPVRAVAASTSIPVPVRSSQSVWPWIAGIWMFGACVVLSVPMFGRILLGRTIRRANRIDREEWPALKETMGVRRRVDLYQGEQAQMPMTWGLLRPVVLIPAEFGGWTPERRRDVLLHELAHVRRFDCLTQAVAQLACAVYWFNPLAWIAAARMRVERERACDDLVLTLGGLPSEYAGSLLEMARTLRSGRAAALAAVSMARPSQLEGRLLAVLDPNRPRRGFSRRSAALAALLGLMFLPPISALRLSAQVVKSAGSSKETMIVTGRVLDPDGKPVENASVDMYGRPSSPWGMRTWPPNILSEIVVLGRAATDQNGRFQANVPRNWAAQVHELRILAGKAGFGVVETVINSGAEALTAELQLEPERIRTVKLIDEAGRPVAGLPVDLIGMDRPGPKNPVLFMGHSIDFRGFPEAKGWPTPEPTDAEGRLRLTRIGPGFQIDLFVRDSRFARQRLIVAPAAPSNPNENVFILKAARIIEGRVLAADTARPIANAQIGVDTTSSEKPDAIGYMGGISFNDRFQADGDGRFRINPPFADEYTIVVYPSSGEPYPIFSESLKWTGGTAEMRHDLKVARGVLIRGKVVESATGRPIAGAYIQWVPLQRVVQEFYTSMMPMSSGPDGTFEIAVASGKGHLLINGPTPDFVAESIDEAALHGSSADGARNQAHKIIPFEAKVGENPVPLVVPLRPSLTVKGRAKGPMGQDVEKVGVLTALDFDPGSGSRLGSTWLPLPDGRFEIHGVSPDVGARVSLFDAEHEWGTTIDVDAQDAKREITVWLEPCGRASARLVAPDGSPRANYKLNIEFLAASGRREDQGTAGPMSWVDPKRYTEEHAADAEGRITYPALIPGASYRIRDVRTPKRDQARKDFSVKTGETLDLGDVLIERPEF